MQWIDANYLDSEWSNTVTSQSDFPELIRNLILASLDSTNTIKEIRFPSGDMSRIPGYDGKTDILNITHPFLPEGPCVWELKTSNNYLAAADDDFSKRSNDPDGIVKTQTTYIAVSSKAWKNPRLTKDEWVNNKKMEDPSWKDIKFIDAVDLETWLAFSPAVAADFARKCGKSPKQGASALSEFWLQFINQYEIPINETIVLTSKEKQVEQLLEKLSSPYNQTKICADSIDEIIGFVVAAINTISDNFTRDKFKAKTLIVNDLEAINFFSNKKDMIFIMHPSIAHHSGILVGNNHLILPSARKKQHEECITLVRPTTYELCDTLQSIGYSQEDAMLAAKECGGSIAILSRRRPRISNDRRPEWASETNYIKIMIPALLAGGWDEKNNHDPDIVSRLAETENYSEYRSELMALCQSINERPIIKEDNIWKIIAPIDAFLVLGEFITDKSYNHLREASIEVFSEIDPNLEEPNEDQPFTGFHKNTKYSHWLRNGLATTLLQISALHKHLDIHITGTTPKAFVEDVIASVPNLQNDPRVMISLRAELPTLMEASPDPFLKALEQMLEGEDSVLQHIFAEDDMIFRRSNHYELLWGLETLAWMPELLERVSLILARLTKIDPGGKVLNRPINSLKDIFLLWHPNTYASAEKRFSVLDTIIKHEPEIAWQLVEKLMPESRGFGRNTHKPIYFGTEIKKETITWGIIWDSQKKLFDKAISLAANEPVRWMTLLSSITELKPELRALVIKSFESIISNMTIPQKTECWNLLRDFVYRQKAFSHMEWSLPEADTDTLLSILNTIQPDDLFQLNKWLFDSHSPMLPKYYDDLRKEDSYLKQIRKDRVQEIYDHSGIHGIIDFANMVKEPATLAETYATLNNDLDIYIRTIESAHGTNDHLSHFCSILSSVLQNLHVSWEKLVLKSIQTNNWSDETIVDLILFWPDTPNTWDVASNLGSSIEKLYWTQKRAWRNQSLSHEEVERHAKMLLQNDRASSALEVIHESADSLSLPLIYEILEKAVDEINTGNIRTSNVMLTYYVEKIFESLTQRSDADRNDLARQEYRYLDMLDRKFEVLTIHKILADDPAFYMSLICDIFKSTNEDIGESTEEQKVRARNAYKLLMSFKTIPGYSELDESIDLDTLKEWFFSVVELAEQHDRLPITKQQVGRLFAHAPTDPKDKAWPHQAIREIIDEVKSTELEKGIEIERFNMRGVYSKGIDEGGDQERGLAQQYHQWAELCTVFPRTQEMLTRIENSWLGYADQEDQSARLKRMRQ